MISFFLRQITLALTTVTGVLLVGEILAPGLVLPFLNLHLLVVAALVMNLAVPPSEPVGAGLPRPYRLIPIIPVGVLLIAYAFLLLSGQGPSAMLLGIAMGTIIIAAAIAFVWE